MFFWILIVITAMLLVLLFRAISRGIGAPSMSAGDEGEYYVARHLSKLNSRKYFVINDLVFRKKNGLTCQIDHVVVSPYGVFVIETKNIYGYIHGSEKSKLWRSYWKDGRDLAFDNPVQQNTAHIEALSERLGVGLQIPYYSIIAFTPTADLQVDVKGADVIYWTKIDSVIQWYTDPVLSIEEAKNIYTNILAMNIVDPEVRNKHGREASAHKANFEEQTNIALDNGKCPKCGGRLVKRQGTYGAFYGCSNYPSCRYTHPAA